MLGYQDVKAPRRQDTQASGYSDVKMLRLLKGQYISTLHTNALPIKMLPINTPAIVILPINILPINISPINTQYAEPYASVSYPLLLYLLAL